MEAMVWIVFWVTMATGIVQVIVWGILRRRTSRLRDMEDVYLARLLYCLWLEERAWELAGEHSAVEPLDLYSKDMRRRFGLERGER